MPNFPRRVKLADSRRAKYFKFNDKLPMKYLQKDVQSGVVDYTWNNSYGTDNKGRTHELEPNFEWKDHKLTKGRSEYRLYDKTTKEYIVKNPQVAGTERWEVINGQKMYNGLYHPHTRSKIMENIHAYMIPFLEGLSPITHYPLVIDCEMYDYGKECEISKGRMWDVDNRSAIYHKALADCLQKAGIIKQDDFEHIIGPPRTIFHNLDGDILRRERHLIYKIYYANRS